MSEDEERDPKEELAEIMARLPLRRQKFVQAWTGIARGNSTKAAEMAGYKGERNTLASSGWEVLQSPDVKRAIQLIAETDPMVASRAELQRFWTRIIRGEEAEKVRTMSGAELERDIAMKEKLKASELLGKTHGAFVEKHEHSGADGEPIQVIQFGETKVKF